MRIFLKLFILFLSLIFYPTFSVNAQSRKAAIIKVPTSNAIITQASASILPELLHQEGSRILINSYEIILQKFPENILENRTRQVTQGTVKTSSGFLANIKNENIGDYLVLSFLKSNEKEPKMHIFSLSLKDGQSYTVIDRYNQIQVIFDKPKDLGVCELDKGISSKLQVPTFDFREDEKTIINFPSKPSIDILFGYTPGALTKFNKDVDLVSILADFEIAQMNKSLELSGINVEVKRTCSPVPLSAPKFDNNYATEIAAKQGDGVWDELHVLKKSCKADLVHIFHGGSGGHAYVMKAKSQKFSKWGFSSSKPNTTFSLGANTFRHEIGHNFGAGHYIDPNDPLAKIKLGLYQKSHGSLFKGLSGKSYRSIMTYFSFDPNSTLWEGFSNPNIIEDGVPTGQKGFSENAQTIFESAAIVASYSEAKDENILGDFDYQVVRTFGYKGLTLRAKFKPLVDMPKYEYFSFFLDSALSGTTNLMNNLYFDSFPISKEAVLDINELEGETYVALNPHQNLQSKKIKIPNFNKISVTLGVTNNVLTGSAIDINGNKIEVTGPWLRLLHIATDTLNPKIEAFLTPKLDGTFSYSLNKPGKYYVEWHTVPNLGMNYKTSNTVSFGG